MKLIDTKTNKEVAIGEVVTSFRGEKAVVTGFRPPHKPSSSGRVYVRPLEGEGTREYFPGVYDLKIE